MPSICPLICRLKRPSLSAAKTWNFTLDEPALTIRIVSMASRRCDGGTPAARIGIKGCDGTRSQARAQRIRARCQYDRDARAEHDPGTVRLGEIAQILGKHIAGLEIWNDQNLCSTCNLRLDPLDLCRFHVDGIVKSERTVQQPTCDLTAVRHLAKCR